MKSDLYILFIVISAIVAVMVVGTVKREVIKNRLLFGKNSCSKIMKFVILSPNESFDGLCKIQVRR